MRRRLLPFCILVIFALSLVLTGVAAAADFSGYAWKDTKGPGGGEAYTLAYDSSRNIIYRGSGYNTTSGRGVWKFQNGVWLNTGGGLSAYGITCLACDPLHDVLYAATNNYGVWRCLNPSTAPDWVKIADWGVLSVTSLAYDTTRDLLYAAGGGLQPSRRCANPRTSPVWTDIGGPTLNGSYTGVWSLVYDPVHNTLYGRYGNQLCRCQNPDSYPVWGDMYPPLSSSDLVGSLVYDSMHDVLYIGTEHNVGTDHFAVCSCSNPSGAGTWKLMKTPFSGTNSLAYDQVRDVLYVSSTYALTPYSVWRCASPRTTAVWTDIWGGFSSCGVFSMVYDSSRNFLYAGTDWNGVMRCTSPDTSPSWAGTGAAFSSVYVRCMAYDSAHDVLYLGASGTCNGVWRCANTTTAPVWTFIGGGLAYGRYDSPADLVYDPARDILYEGCYDVWRCTNPRTAPAWTAIGGPAQGGGDVSALDYDSARNILYVGGAYAYGVWRVTNPDASTYAWTKISTDNPAYIESMTYDPVHDNIYVGVAVEGVWRCDTPRTSPTWTQITSQSYPNNYFDAVTYDPVHDVLYAAPGVGVMRCTNPRTSPDWRGIGGIISFTEIKDLTYDSTHDVLYAGSWASGILSGDTTGVFYCTDPWSFYYWTSTMGGIKTSGADSLLYDAGRNVLFAGSQGLWYWNPSSTLAINSISPNNGVNNGTVSITDLEGARFEAGASVILRRSGQKDIFATGVQVVSANKITCTFNLNGVVTGAWDVVVRNPNGQEVTMVSGFTVNAPAAPCGSSAGLTVALFGGLLGMLSLAGAGLSRRRRRKPG